MIHDPWAASGALFTLNGTLAYLRLWAQIKCKVDLLNAAILAVSCIMCAVAFFTAG